MQEAPDPITKLTWDNAVMVSHTLAKKIGIKNYDVVEVSAGKYSVKGVIWVVPGQEGRYRNLKTWLWTSSDRKSGRKQWI